MTNIFKNILLKLVLYFGDIEVEVSENVVRKLAYGLISTPKGERVQLNMKHGRVFFKII